MKTLVDALQDIRAARIQMERLNDRLPDIIGAEALRVIDDNFEKEGYNSGSGIERWPARSSETNKAYDKRRGGLKGSVFNSKNKLLQQTGNLRASIRKLKQGRNVFVGVNLLKVPYAKIHNEGGQGLMYDKISFKMPKRQYMPMPHERPNPVILLRAKRKIEFEHARIMSKFRK